jgi:hypothetical protein
VYHDGGFVLRTRYCKRIIITTRVHIYAYRRLRINASYHIRMCTSGDLSVGVLAVSFGCRRSDHGFLLATRNRTAVAGTVFARV